MRFLPLILAAAFCCSTLSTKAAEAPADSDTDSAAVREILLPAEFARFAPRTALDMARQVPGFPIDEGDQERGFGQADANVLVNGRRISGKSNGPVEALTRIPADDVVRLEILDGASLDIGGLSGQVLNVVTGSSAGISGRYRYSPEGRTDHVPFRWGNAAVALSGGADGTEWTLSFENDQQHFGSEGPEFVTDGAGNLLDERAERVTEMFDQPNLSGSFTREQRNGNVLNLTGAAGWFLFDFEEISQRNPIPEALDRAQGVRELQQTEDEFGFEVGADYAFDIGPGRLKLIGLYGYEHSPSEAQVDFRFAEEGRILQGTVFNRTADEAESVLRGEYTFAALGGDWQWSLEGAQNYLDIEADLFIRNSAGELEPAVLPGASSRVEEDRVEMTLSYSRALSDSVQFQTSIGAEYSEISQSGEFGQTRDFVRPKGFASLNWSASKTLDVSLQVDRQVGQLDFFDVIASTDVNQGRVNVTNADLVPPQSWLTNLQLQQSLGAYGSLTLSGFYEDISDIVDLIPITDDLGDDVNAGTQIVGQAPGNIDSAKRYGASLNATLLFDPLGWRGARLDLEASYTDSEVIDPLLGSNRRISNDDYVEYEVVFRQDFPGTTWAVALEAFFRESTPLVRLDETSLFRQSVAFTRVVVENKDVFGATLRASVGNLNDRSNDFSRTLFNDRASNSVAFREERFLDFGLLFRLELEGNF